MAKKTKAELEEDLEQVMGLLKNLQGDYDNLKDRVVENTVRYAIAEGSCREGTAEFLADVLDVDRREASELYNLRAMDSQVTITITLDYNSNEHDLAHYAFNLDEENWAVKSLAQGAVGNSQHFTAVMPEGVVVTNVEAVHVR